MVNPYIRMYQIKDILVITIRNKCLRKNIDIRSGLSYHNVNGKPQTPRWGGLHMDYFKEFEALYKKLDKGDIAFVKILYTLVLRHLERRGKV